MNTRQITVPSLFRIQKSLGSLESEVMQIIWGKDESTVREVLTKLQQEKTIAYTTVMTVMDNLYKKGYLTRKKIKKSYYYFPKESKEALTHKAIVTVFHDLASNYGKFRILSSLVGYGLLPFPPFPILYGLSFTLFSTLLIFSSWDLLQNLQFFGTIDYLQLTLSDPTILSDKLHYLIPAFVESLPIINLSTTIISFILVVTLLKKLLQLVDLEVPTLHRFGGVT